MNNFWPKWSQFLHRITDKHYGKRRISVVCVDKILHGYVEEDRGDEYVVFLEDVGHITLWRWRIPVPVTHVIMIEKGDPDIVACNL